VTHGVLRDLLLLALLSAFACAAPLVLLGVL